MFDASHILTGTDYSKSSEGAVREALRLAAADASRKVRVLHVTPNIKDVETTRQQVLDWVCALPEFSNLHHPSQVIIDLEEGKVAEAFIRCAKRTGASMITVGPRARGFVETWLTGGLAEKLFHSAHIPVLATRQTKEGGYRNILVPLDLSGNSVEALDMAALMLDPSSGATHPEAKLHLLHVAHRVGGVSAKRSLELPVQRDACGRLKVLAEKRGIADRVSSYTASFGVVHDIIPKQVNALDLDLICMVSKHSGSFLGSTVDAVLRNVEVPMMVAWRT